MPAYTLGLFANMYPAFDGDYRGIFISQMVRDLEERGITVKKAVKKSPSVTGYIPFYWQSLLLRRDRSLDILQAEYIPHSSIIPAFVKRNDIPLVLKFHGDDARIYPFRNRFNMAMTKVMIRRADHIITSSEEIRRTVIGIGGDPERTTFVHTGIDTGYFSPGCRSESRKTLGLPASATIFAFVGRLHPSKGIPEIVRVAEACPEYLFILIGPGNIPAHPENCIFPGVGKAGEGVREWLRAADCCILPTHTEAVPTSVMEAFACGIPAITTDVGGCPEIVDTGTSGLMVPVSDVHALKEAVRWMGTHPEERAEMGRKARITAAERYDHNFLIEKLIAIHKSLID
jgi:teichuronic acid biosynthesis glycosyltransferase TuaC